jgi:hypothetical protein
MKKKKIDFAKPIWSMVFYRNKLCGNFKSEHDVSLSFYIAQVDDGEQAALTVSMFRGVGGTKSVHSSMTLDCGEVTSLIDALILLRTRVNGRGK